LPTLDPGDKIQVIFDGVTYNYEVEDMFEVRPTDVYILEQNETDPYLSLVTCTPPGHPLRPKRLVVRAKIVDDELSNAKSDVILTPRAVTL
jgi:sortase A